MTGRYIIIDNTVVKMKEILKFLRDLSRHNNKEWFTANFMRLKNFCLVMNVDDEFITLPDWAKRVAELFRTTKPFNDYVNRAVDYAKSVKY